MKNPFIIGEEVILNTLPRAVPTLSAISLIIGIGVNIVTFIAGVKAISSGIDETENNNK